MSVGSSASHEEPSPGREAHPRGFLGLDDDETALLGQLFGEIVAPLGLDGARVVSALAEGVPLSKALGLPARLDEVLYARAHSWFSAGRIDRAEPLFRALCVLDPQSADYWVGFGVCQRMLDRQEEAELAFATAATLRPDWAVPHFHAATQAVARGDWDKAASHLAAFRARTLAGLPGPMLQEAARLSNALNWRAERQGAPPRP